MSCVRASAISRLILCFMGASAPAVAGGFIFAGTSDPDSITHVSNYFGSGGEVTVTLCIDPASPNAASMVIPVQNIVTTINDFQAVSPNLLTGGDTNVGGAFDFESVALHEVGHCIGMSHPNLGSQTGVTDTNSTNTTKGANGVFNEGAGGDGIFGSADDVRGDDVNLVWFRKVDNDPFALGTVFDTSTYSVDVADLPGGDAFVANADRTVGVTHYGVTATEAVMQQLSFFGEDQRQWAADDVATLSLGMSGVDETQGTADDYTIRAEYAGLTTSCDLVLRFNNAATGFAVCSVGGSGLGGGHWRITSATASFNTGYTWFFNDVEKVEGNIFADGFESGDTSAWSLP